jgi:hypothetical protein
MDTTNLRESATDAIRFWEPRRLIYNAVLAAIVLIYFAMSYPASKAQLSLNGALGVFLLAVLANIAYCAAYAADIFAQISGYRELWRKYRWILFLIGHTFRRNYHTLRSDGHVLSPHGRALQSWDPVEHLASIVALMIACQANLRRNPQRVITCPSKS